MGFTYTHTYTHTYTNTHTYTHTTYCYYKECLLSLSLHVCVTYMSANGIVAGFHQSIVAAGAVLVIREFID